MSLSSLIRPNVPTPEKIGTEVGTGRIFQLKISGLSVAVPTSQPITPARVHERAHARAHALTRGYMGQLGRWDGRFEINGLRRPNPASQSYIVGTEG